MVATRALFKIERSFPFKARTFEIPLRNANILAGIVDTNRGLGYNKSSSASLYLQKLNDIMFERRYAGFSMLNGYTCQLSLNSGSHTLWDGYNTIV